MRPREREYEVDLGGRAEQIYRHVALVRIALLGIVGPGLKAR
jgi:hypothetical protein